MSVTNANENLDVNFQIMYFLSILSTIISKPFTYIFIWEEKNIFQNNCIHDGGADVSVTNKMFAHLSQALP